MISYQAGQLRAARRVRHTNGKPTITAGIATASRASFVRDADAIWAIGARRTSCAASLSTWAVAEPTALNRGLTETIIAALPCRTARRDTGTDWVGIGWRRCDANSRVRIGADDTRGTALLATLDFRFLALLLFSLFLGLKRIIAASDDERANACCSEQASNNVSSVMSLNQ
jgi:hypothetical protein